MMTDIRFACRQLLKSPGFALLAVLTLAIAIGLNTAIFNLIDDLFLRGLPFRDVGRVVHMYANAKERDLNEIPLSAPRFIHYREGETIFSDFAASCVWSPPREWVRSSSVSLWDSRLRLRSAA